MFQEHCAFDKISKITSAFREKLIVLARRKLKVSQLINPEQKVCLGLLKR